MDHRFVLDYNLMADKELVKIYRNLSESERRHITREMLLHIPILNWLDTNIGHITMEVDVGLEFIIGNGWRLHNYMYDHDIGKKSEIWFDPFVDKQKITEFALRWIR
jgi:hypothetical protein